MSSPSTLKWIDLWNQRIHSYIGLFLLLFVWVYAVSGLVLNHPKWQFTNFWPQRQESVSESTVRIPSAPTNLAKTQDLMGQLGLSGEIDQITSKPDHFDFRLGKPGQIVNVAVDLASAKASVKQIKVNTWGVLNSLHHLTGVHADNPALARNRIATRIWSFALDATCVGMLLLALGGVWVWCRRKESLLPGFIALLLGLLACGFFVFAL